MPRHQAGRRRAPSARRRRSLGGSRRLLGVSATLLVLGASLLAYQHRHGILGGAPTAPAAIGAPASTPPTAETSTSGPPCARGSVRLLQLPDRGAPGGRRGVWVYVPGRGDLATVPVLYWLHGQPGGAGDVTQTGLADLLDRRTCAGAVPVEVVAPDGNAADGSDTEWADAADGRFRVESFVTGALRTAIEGRHPRPASRRAVAGFSTGGYGAMELALRHRDLYGEVLSVGGYFRVDDRDHVFGTDLAAHDPKIGVVHAQGLRVFLGQGNDDTEPLVQGEPADYAQRLRTAGADVTTLVVPGGHSYRTVAAVLDRAGLDWIQRGFS